MDEDRDVIEELPPSEDLANVSAALSKLRAKLMELKSERGPPVERALGNLRLIQSEVVEESMRTSGEMSVAGQFLVRQHMNRAKEALKDVSVDHRAMHNAVSKIGKEIERYLCRNLSSLLKNQMNIEETLPARSAVSELFYFHLTASGYADSAKCLRKEANLVDLCNDDYTERMSCGDVKECLERRDIIPLFQWTVLNDNSNMRLRADLEKMHLITLITQGRSMDAINFCRSIKTLVNEDREIEQLLSAAFMFPIGKTLYSKFFTSTTWEVLARNVIFSITQDARVLTSLMKAGILALPKLLNVKALISARQDFMFSGDELPIEIPLEERFHSTLTCPILRQQVTVNNPAMRLSCGHVISRDAVQRLSQTSRQLSRVLRLKCPYCPQESSPNDAIEVIF